MLKRILIAIIVLFAVSGTAHAENKLKSFFKKLGKGIQQELGQKSKRKNGDTSTRQSNPAIQYTENDVEGVCYVYTASGIKLDEEICTRHFKCEASQRCYYDYYWPSGSKTVVELNRKRHAKLINGSKFNWINVEGRSCLKSRQTSRLFCFEVQSIEIAEEDVQSEPSVILQDFQSERLKENTRWLAAIADEMSSKQPTLQNLIATNGFSILKPDLYQRQISEELYRRVFESRVSTVRYLSVQDAEKTIVAHFDGQTLDTLWPTVAYRDCERDLVGIPKEKAGIHADVRKFCLIEADLYIKRTSFGEAKHQADKVKSLTVDYAGLRDANWYAFNNEMLPRIPKQYHKQVERQFYDLIKVRYQKSVSKATDEMQTAYAIAVPFQDSEKKAVEYCQYQTQLPRSYQNACSQAKRAFSKKKEKARCVRTLRGFGSYTSMLDELIYASGTQYKPIKIRKMLCDGATNRPDLKTKFVSNGFAFWKYDKIEVLNASDTLILSLEIEERAVADNRGFLKYLTDIATGENERRLNSIWHGSKTREYHSPMTHLGNPSIALGCIYGFLDCKSQSN